eukprot:COSAG02_NODE_588_length_19902_cov_115.928900_8_plen_88_part_00
MLPQRCSTPHLPSAVRSSADWNETTLLVLHSTVPFCPDQRPRSRQTRLVCSRIRRRPPWWRDSAVTGVISHSTGRKVLTGTPRVRYA